MRLTATGGALALALAMTLGNTSAAIVRDGTRHGPDPSPYVDVLYDVSALSASDAWAVGYAAGEAIPGSGGERVSKHLTAHWDGSRWSTVWSPAQVGDGELHGVSAASSNDVWAVGYASQRTLIIHWDGIKWSKVWSPNPFADGYGYLNDVTALSATDAWAVGSYYDGFRGKTLVLHWDGTRWSRVWSPTPGDSGSLTGVTAFSPTDAWAVGSFGDPVTRVGRTLTLHWNGAAWSKVSSPSEGSFATTLKSVSGASATDVWAVGGFSVADNDRRGIVLHWDGRKWSNVVLQADLSRSGWLWAIDEVSPSDVWVVGASTVLHSDGESWSAVWSSDPNSGPSMFGVVAPSPNDVWAVGAIFSGTAPSPRTWILHWDGADWIEM